MTPATKVLIANIFLVITVGLLIVMFCGMVGWIPKLASTRELALLCVVLAVGGGGFRRSARAARLQSPLAPPRNETLL